MGIRERADAEREREGSGEARPAKGGGGGEGAATRGKRRDARAAPSPRLGCGRETLTTSGVCGEEMRPPQERAANENRMAVRDPRRNAGKGYSCVHGKVIIISAEVKHSGGSVFHLLRLGACAGGERVGGLVRRAWWVTFSEGRQDREALGGEAEPWGGRALGRPSERTASAPALRMLALPPGLGGQLSLGAVRGCLPSARPWAEAGEAEGEA